MTDGPRYTAETTHILPELESGRDCGIARIAVNQIEWQRKRKIFVCSCGKPPAQGSQPWVWWHTTGRHFNHRHPQSNHRKI